MKYYIATTLSRAPQHNAVRDDLGRLGYELTYDWTTHGSVKHVSTARLQEVAANEGRGILAADFVVVLLPGGKGTHVELGLSIASQKRVFVHSEDPGVFEVGPEVCAFYHYPEVIRMCCPVAEVGNHVHLILSRNLASCS